MKRFGLLILIFVMSVGLTLSAYAQDGGDKPSLADLEMGAWNTIDGGEGTMCASGTPYNFHFRPTESDDLLVFFNGGGACWFGLICDPNGSPTYTQTIDAGGNDVPNNPPSGIFDFANPENPFADYNVLFVPYCTGDVHLGDATVSYEVAAADGGDAAEVAINHNGYNNAMSALEWVYENYEGFDRIFVTGSSAGAIASPFYTAIAAEAYPDAVITQLGDGAGGYRSEAIPQLFDLWGFNALMSEMMEEEVAFSSIEEIYVATGLAYPDVVLSQYNTADDAVQYSFLGLLGVTDTPLSELIAANIADIEAGLEADLPAFLAGGDVHTILRSPETYTYAANGVRFIDWLTALANGEMVEDATCVDCTAPEVVEMAE